MCASVVFLVSETVIMASQQLIFDSRHGTCKWRTHKISFFLQFLSIMFASLQSSFSSAKDTYYLGFLSPFPIENKDSLIPIHLAQQWQSAFQVALEVLNSENRTYQLQSVLADTSCSWMKVLSLSHIMDQKNLIGVVGPACSGAALSATQYFDQETPIVSFAATHESLSNRNNYPNFFRTVYGDKYQTLAMLSVMEKLDIWNATIICAKDYYSLSIGSSIQQIAIERILSMKVLDLGEDSLININQVREILDGLNANNAVILALPPLTARDFWTLAVQMGKTDFPRWYFGTDGVTAFNPSIDGSTDLVQAIQGETGISPLDGDAMTIMGCKKYFDYWEMKNYPGLPQGGLYNARSYVTHLIDTVALYFKIVDDLVESNLSVNASAVLSALQGSGIGSPIVNGCTGNVEIDPETGSRKVSPSRPSIYNVVSFEQNNWKLSARVLNVTFINIQPIFRPTSASNKSNIKKKNRKGILIAGLVLFSAASIILLAVLLVYFLRRRGAQATNFVRMRRHSTSL